MEDYSANIDRPNDPAGFFANEIGLNQQFPGRCSIDFSVAVVLPAGGCGERTGLSTPKQFCTFLNRPLISYTIQAFERVSWIENVIVVVAKESFQTMTDIVQQFSHNKVMVVLGGATRHRSIFSGLKAFSGRPDGISLKKPKVVIIHDAVRPFIEEDFLFRIAIAAEEHGASGAIRPLVSTVIATTSDGFLDHSLERAKYRASEMPQGFLYDTIYRAYQQCSELDFDFGTECLHLALHYCGTSAKLIEGPPSLWKVTYQKDLLAAEAVIKDTLSRTACVVTGGRSESARLAAELQKALGDRNMQVDVLSSGLGNGATAISETWNFIHVTVSVSCWAEIGELLKALQESDRAVLYPVVVILVHLNVSPDSSLNERMERLGAIRDVATEAKRKNILLYSILLNNVEGAELWEKAAEKVSQIAAALIKDRNSALTGQLLVV